MFLMFLLYFTKKNVSYIYIYLHMYILWSLSHRPTTSHKNMSQGPKAPKPKSENEKTERRERKKKFLSAIQNRGKRSERRSRESESLRDLPAARRRRRRRSSCRGSLCDGKVRAESRLFIHSKSTTQCLQI